jgi:hypothetical protein
MDLPNFANLTFINRSQTFKLSSFNLIISLINLQVYLSLDLPTNFSRFISLGLEFLGWSCIIVVVELSIAHVSSGDRVVELLAA